MATGVLEQRFASWARGVAVVATAILMAAAPLSPASAALTKQATAKTAQAAKAHGKKTAGKKKAKTAKAAKAAKSAKTAKLTKNTPNLALAAKAKSASSRAAGKRTAARRGNAVAMRQTRPSPGSQTSGDPLALKSSVALVLDQDTQEVLLRKNDQAVLPIASLTKLMTGLLVSEAGLPLDETITITQDDVDTEKGSRSRLAVGTRLTRGELLHLALMSSENRAAHALGRTFPGGMNRFVTLMNARAMTLGMNNTRYVEPTGLSSDNRSSARDLAALVAAAAQQPLLRQLTTSPSYEVAVGHRVLQYNNTNRLVHDPDWRIDVQKTGYISEAGECLVMQAHVAGRELIMVFLDSSGKYSRLADAERVRNWIELRHPASRVAGNADANGRS